MSGRFRYFVEGPCEKVFVKAFMFCDGQSFQEGQIEVINFVNERISRAFARTIQRNSKVVIVIDTDVENTEILDSNIDMLQKVSMISKEDIYIVMSIHSFEDEIVYSCLNVSNIHQLFSTSGISEFKKKFIAHKELNKKLESVGFDMNKIWSRKPTNVFSKYQNNGNKIKKHS